MNAKQAVRHAIEEVECPEEYPSYKVEVNAIMLIAQKLTKDRVTRHIVRKYFNETDMMEVIFIDKGLEYIEELKSMPVNRRNDEI